jgi:hypothetical protein
MKGGDATMGGPVKRRPSLIGGSINPNRFNQA